MTERNYEAVRRATLGSMLAAADRRRKQRAAALLAIPALLLVSAALLLARGPASQTMTTPRAIVRAENAFPRIRIVSGSPGVLQRFEPAAEVSRIRIVDDSAIAGALAQARSAEGFVRVGERVWSAAELDALRAAQ